MTGQAVDKLLVDVTGKVDNHHTASLGVGMEHDELHGFTATALATVEHTVSLPSGNTPHHEHWL